jgi:hypothetical protein
MSKQEGKIDRATFRQVHQEQRERAKQGPAGYTTTTRAVIRLIEGQLKEARIGEYTIQCDEAKSRKGGGKSPLPLQYFVAATGFWMFSQLTRYASQLDIEIEDAEMDIRMTYDTRGKLLLADVSPACRAELHF